jgi:tetratricopeptide (TPR) repeat protein
MIATMRAAALTLAVVIGVSLSAPVPAAEDEGGAPVSGSMAGQKKPAELRAEQLDVLFARLHTSDGSPATGIEQKIWELWSASDSPTAEILLQQAQRAMDGGAPAEAMSILDRLIGAYPEFAEAWNKRATLYFLMKKDDRSLSDIDKVLDLEPRHFGALAGRGMIYQRQKKYALARRAFEDALAINPGLEQVRSALKQLDRLEQGI